MTQPTVTQEDRDAAARLHGYANWAVWESVPHHEAAWMQLCAKDFARHREAAEAAIAAWNTRAQPEAALEALAEVLCTERCAQSGDPPCSKAAPDEPHCDECLGMAQAVIEHRAQPEAAPVEAKQ